MTTRSQRRLTCRRYFNKVRVSKTNVRLSAVVHPLLSMTLIQSFLNFSMHVSPKRGGFNSLCFSFTEQSLSMYLITNHQCPMSNHQCPMSNHQCPMSNIQSPITNHQCPITNHQCPITNHQCPMSNVQCLMSKCHHIPTRCSLVGDSNVQCAITGDSMGHRRAEIYTSSRYN